MREFRVIPMLLLSGNGFVKTVNFKKPVYLGDSLNIIKLLNDKEVDEIVIFNIIRDREKSLNFSKLSEIASECFVPLSYGGGIDSLDNASKIFESGFEKVILNTNALKKNLLKDISNKYGSSSTVACVDIKKNFFRSDSIYIKNGNKRVGSDILDYVLKLQDNGAGEIILQSIDRDGTYKGYDLDLIELISSKLEIPLVAAGGASNLQDFKSAINSGASAVAAGSLFSFKGSHRAVLINYPTRNKLIKELYETK